MSHECAVKKWLVDDQLESFGCFVSGRKMFGQRRLQRYPAAVERVEVDQRDFGLNHTEKIYLNPKNLFKNVSVSACGNLAKKILSLFFKLKFYQEVKFEKQLSVKLLSTHLISPYVTLTCPIMRGLLSIP